MNTLYLNPQDLPEKLHFKEKKRTLGNAQKHAEVAELVYAHDSKSCSFGSEGSTPSFGTKEVI